MKKIKVLRIIARLNIGGPAIHTVLLTQGLNKERFDSLLVCGSIDKTEGDMSYYASQMGVKPIFIPELKRELSIVNDIISFKKIFNIIRKERPDIIHTHTAKAGAIGRSAGIVYNLLNRSKQAKLVHTFHGHVFEGYFGRFKAKVFILIERFLARFTSKIVTVSESVKNGLVSLGIGTARKIEVIRLGFELSGLLDIGPKAGQGDLEIGIVGRLVPVKNHRLFLDAAAKIIRDNPQAKLRFKIIGDGELRKELEEYARNLDIGAHVEFLGWQKDLSAIYRTLDIVALTSVNEGTPVSLIEAMASGKAVVSTSVGGVRELLGVPLGARKADSGLGFEILERGVAVESGDISGFSAALLYLSKDSALRKALGLCSREFVRNGFSKERLIKDIEGLYESLLNPQ